jgi:hypothetical protein
VQPAKGDGVGDGAGDAAHFVSPADQGLFGRIGDHEGVFGDQYLEHANGSDTFRRNLVVKTAHSQKCEAAAPVDKSP